MALKTYDFEGKPHTMAEIRKMVPALGYSAILSALAAGRNTRLAMVTFCPRRASTNATKRTVAARGKPKELGRTW